MDIRSEYGVSRRNTVVGVGATESVQPETVPSARELMLLCKLMAYVPQLQEWEG